jgi:IclR family pca regulon transcriptional regulator
MNRTAVQRFTDTLVQLGFLGKNRHKEFFLGAKVVALGFAYLQGSELIRLAASYLKDFSVRMGRTVNMAVLDDVEVVFLYRNEVRKFLKYDLRAGSRLPSHCTATGKVLLASLDDEELKARLERMKFERMTSWTIVEKKAFFEDIGKTRARGISISDREMSPNLYSIGVPLLNHEKKIVAAVNLSRYSDELEVTSPEEDTQAVVDQGREISGLMGYEGEYPVIRAGSGEGKVA